MLFVYVFVVFCVILAGTVSNTYAQDQETVRLEDVSRGELLFKSEGGEFLPAPDLNRKVVINVHGLTARTIVEQEFFNNTSTAQDALYIFPLPQDSGVDSLSMTIGDRHIIGQIKEKAEAKAIYDHAKTEGKKASLLVQKRPNAFTTQVANIAAGEHVTITIEYQQIVEYKEGFFHLRYPTAITPRYSPGTTADNADGLEGHVSFNKGMSLTEIPPLSQQTSPLQITVNLNAGIPLCCISALYHQISREEKGLNQYLINMESTGSFQDFVLEWEPAEHALNAALFNEKKDGENYGMLMLLPPQKIEKANVTAREVTFILDRSGSMAGSSMKQAREALIAALATLSPQDSFNIIAFNHESDKLFAKAVIASEKNMWKAEAWLNKTIADGGTEMLPALRDAFTGHPTSDALSQVIFITDGAVDNEEQLLTFIHNNVGNRRLFTIGIGAAPNSYLLTRAALMGRGSHTSIGKISEVKTRIASIFTKISNPVLHQLQLKSVAENLESYPKRLPDTYLGDPLLIFFKGGEGEEVELSGKLGEKDWSSSFSLHDGENNSGIAALWGRQKIRSLMDDATMGGDQKTIKEQIIETALTYNLVSKYTSLVAVENAPPPPSVHSSADTLSKKRSAPLLAANSQAATPAPFFAGSSQTATPAQLLQILGGLAIFLSCILIVLLRRN